MQCNCGGLSPYTHQIVRNKKVVAEYEKCRACGRIMWRYGQEYIKREQEKLTLNT